MNIVTVMSEKLLKANRRLPVGRTTAAAGRKPGAERPRLSARYIIAMAHDDRKPHPVPPRVGSGDPDPELEKKLKRHPEDQDAKVDVGSDESMDASDPPASSQPGQKDEPVPSSTFPE